MQKFDIVKIIGENQVTRLEAVLARMVELEASQDPYMLQVIDLVIFLLSHVVTLQLLLFGNVYNNICHCIGYLNIAYKHFLFMME